MYKVRIDYFPLDAGCAQMCSHCAFKKRVDGSNSGATVTETQETFSILEQLLKKRRINYHFGLMGNHNVPIPDFTFPELVKMFSVQCDIPFTQSEVVAFSEKLKAILSEKKLNPSYVVITLCSHSHIISNDETNMASMLIEQITPWYFEIGKYIRISYNSNQVKRSIYDKDTDSIISSHKEHFRPLIKKYAGKNKIYGKEAAENTFLDGDFKMLYSHYSTNVQKKSIHLNHRVISTEFTQTNNYEFNLKIGNVNYSEEYEANFTIAKKGVMLMHSTIGINNPIFWMTHLDFRECVVRTNKKYPKMIETVNELLSQNYFLYQELFKSGMRDAEMMLGFNKYRPRFL